MASQEDLTALVQAHRIGHLATADSPGTPHLVPICFVYDGHAIYSAIDHKPKRRTGYGMKRIRNILENPRVAFLVHHYEEDWQQLYHVLIRGTASILESGPEHQRALRLQWPRGHSSLHRARRDCRVRRWDVRCFAHPLFDVSSHADY